MSSGNSQSGNSLRTTKRIKLLGDIEKSENTWLLDEENGGLLKQSKGTPRTAGFR